MAGMDNSVCRKDWRWFFWLVSVRCGKLRDLRADVKGWKAGVLVLWFVIVHGDAGRYWNDWNEVGAAVVKGGKVFVDIDAVSVEGVEGAGSVDEVDSFDRVVVAVAAAGVSVGIEDGGNVEGAGVVGGADDVEVVATAVVEGRDDVGGVV
jgi:hypothetical protein